MILHGARALRDFRHGQKSNFLQSSRLQKISGRFTLRYNIIKTGQLLRPYLRTVGKLCLGRYRSKNGWSPGTKPKRITAIVWETPTVGDVRDMAEPLTESPYL